MPKNGESCKYSSLIKYNCYTEKPYLAKSKPKPKTKQTNKNNSIFFLVSLFVVFKMLNFNVSFFG